MENRVVVMITCVHRLHAAKCCYNNSKFYCLWILGASKGKGVQKSRRDIIVGANVQTDQDWVRLRIQVFFIGRKDQANCSILAALLGYAGLPVSRRAGN